MSVCLYIFVNYLFCRQATNSYTCPTTDDTAKNSVQGTIKEAKERLKKANIKYKIACSKLTSATKFGTKQKRIEEAAKNEVQKVASFISHQRDVIKKAQNEVESAKHEVARLKEEIVRSENIAHVEEENSTVPDLQMDREDPNEASTVGTHSEFVTFRYFDDTMKAFEERMKRIEALLEKHIGNLKEMKTVVVIIPTLLVNLHIVY